MNVTNNAAGPRGFNVLKKGVPVMVLLQSGETIEDVELADKDDQAFLGMVKVRDLLVEKGKGILKAAEDAAEPQVQPVKPAADTREAVDPAKMTPEQIADTKQRKPGV